MKHILLILAIFFFCVTIAGFLINENLFRTLTCAFWMVICPLVIGGVLLCIHIDKKRKRSPYRGPTLHFERVFLLLFDYALKTQPALSPALMALLITSLICSVVIEPSQTILIFIETDFFSSPRFLPA